MTRDECDDVEPGSVKVYPANCVEFGRSEWLAMIEDPKITKRILEYFARDDVSWPASAQVDTLHSQFPDIDVSTLEYHIYCCMEVGLLSGQWRMVRAFEGASLVIGHIDGLTPRGGDFVRDARTDLWSKAWSTLADAGIEATTKRLAEVMAGLAKDILPGG